MCLAKLTRSLKYLPLFLLGREEQLVVAELTGGLGAPRPEIGRHGVGTQRHEWARHVRPWSRAALGISSDQSANAEEERRDGHNHSDRTRQRSTERRPAQR